MSDVVHGTILITGGAGFIGSHLVDFWLSQQRKVVVLDDLSRGSLKNINRHSNNGSMLFIKMDLANQKDYPNLVNIIEEHRPELIIHLAAINGTEHFYENSLKVVTTNSLVTLNLVNAIGSVKSLTCGQWLPKFIYASSSEVYGEPQIIPTPETARTDLRTTEIRDSYAAGKLVGEFYTKLGCEKHSIPWLVLRIFNVYGPRMVSTKYGQVIPEFIHRIRSGEYPLHIIGSGENTRSFNHIDDFVVLLHKLLQASSWNEIINLGNDNEISINSLAMKVFSAMGLSPDVIHTDGRSGDHMRRCPDIDKLLGYVGEYEFKDLDRGIAELVQLSS